MAEDLFTQANQAQQNVYDMSKASGNLEKMLRDAVNERFTSSPLYGQREEAGKNLMTTPANTRAELANMAQSGQAILSPSQQESVVAGRRAAAVAPLMTINDLIQNRTGGMENTINQGLGAWNTMLTAEQNRATSLQNQAQGEWERQMKEREYELAVAKANQANKPDFLTQLLSMSQQAKQGVGSAGQAVSYMDKDGKPVTTGMEGISSLLSPDILIGAVASGKLSPTEAEFLGNYGKVAGFDKESNAKVEDALAQINYLNSIKPKNILDIGNLVTYQTSKKVAAQSIAKSFEGGRMSDSDRAFYQGLVPDAWDPTYNSKMKGIKNALEVSAGMRSPENPKLVDPKTNQIYTYDNISDAEYKADLKSGYIPAD